MCQFYVLLIIATVPIEAPTTTGLQHTHTHTHTHLNSALCVHRNNLLLPKGTFRD